MDVEIVEKKEKNHSRRGTTRVDTRVNPWHFWGCSPTPAQFPGIVQSQDELRVIRRLTTDLVAPDNVAEFARERDL